MNSVVRNGLLLQMVSSKAVPAASVDFQPVPAQLEAVEGGSAGKSILDVAARQVLGQAAFHAEQMVVVAAVAQLVVELIVLQHHATQDAGFDQDLEDSVDRRPPRSGGSC